MHNINPVVLVIAAYFIIVAAFMFDWLVDLFRSK